MSIKKKYNINETQYLWYIITAVRGKEELVADSLRKKIHSYGFDELVDEIKVLKEKKVTYQFYSQDESPKRMVNTSKIKWETIETNGVIKYRRTKTEEVNKFPGYIFIKMHIVDELWFLIRNTKDVTGLVGSSGRNSKPIPISTMEINNLFNSNLDEKIEIVDDSIPLTDTIVEKDYFEAHFKLNDLVKIISMDTVGIVSSIDNTKGTCNVEVEFLGDKSTFENVKFEDIEVIHED